MNRTFTCNRLRELLLPLVTVLLLTLPARAAAAAGSGAQAAEKTYRHPAGVSFRYPKDWKVVEWPGQVQLVPPGASQDAATATEVYQVSVASASGAKKIDDPRLLQSMNEEMGKALPFLQREGATGKIAPRPNALPGVRLVWQGTAPTGKVIRVQNYMVLHGDLVYALTAMGEPSRVKKRDAALRRIAAGFTRTEPERDSALRGAWQATSSSSYSSPGFSMATQKKTRVTLRPDGTCSLVQSSRAVGGTADVGADVPGDDEKAEGRWYAARGRLTLLLKGPDGSVAAAVEMQYGVSGAPGSRTLTFKLPNGSRDTLHEAE